MLELLVPAGSPEAVTAAVQNGADAVYLSFDELSGCRKAVNFSDEAFEAAVRYCRVRGCKVYLALNCVVREDELPKAGGLALRAQRAGVDAIILRDLGLMAILRRLLPDMPLFADYHLGFYTMDSLKTAKALGFRRVFLPPELSLSEICRLASAPVETAVFVQTPMCASASGLCSMSAVAGRESADRGLCSELCREDYTFGGRWDNKPLSFKDRSLLSSIPKLTEAGVTCVCIGSRERRPEYTAVYTGAFSQMIHENRKPSAADLEKMETAFCRCGVTESDAYEPASEWKEPDWKIEKYCAEIRRAYSETELRRVPVSFAVLARGEDRPIHLGVQDDCGNCTVLEGPVASAQEGDISLSEAGLSESMYRTAGTPFRCIDLKTELKEGLKVSGMELDAARRRLLYKLSEERARLPERREGSFPEEPATDETVELQGITFSFRTAAQMTPEMAALQPLRIYVPAEVLLENPQAAEPFIRAESEVTAVLPPVVSGPAEEQQLAEMLQGLRGLGIETVSCSSLSLAATAMQAGFRAAGDISLQVTNAYSLQALAAAGFVSAVISPELSFEQIGCLPKPMKTEVIAYGRIPAMITQPCLLKASAGRCTCTVPGQMADTHGGVWPVTQSFGCRNTVWAPRKIWLGDSLGRLTDCGLWAVRMVFSTESPRECLEVANSYIVGNGYRPNGATRGLYYRGTL